MQSVFFSGFAVSATWLVNSRAFLSLYFLPLFPGIDNSYCSCKPSGHKANFKTVLHNDLLMRLKGEYRFTTSGIAFQFQSVTDAKWQPFSSQVLQHKVCFPVSELVTLILSDNRQHHIVLYFLLFPFENSQQILSELLGHQDVEDRVHHCRRGCH